MFNRAIPAAVFAAITCLAVSGLSIVQKGNAVPARAVVVNAPVRHVAAVKRAPSRPAFDAGRAFVDLGCSGCHGDDGIYKDEIKGALGKRPEDVARWIRNAPSIKPDTDMPSFDGKIDEAGSLVLARWMQERAAHL